LLTSCMLFVALQSPAFPQVQVLADTTLELTGLGGTQWTSTSSNFGTVICDVLACSDCNGPCVPRSGTYYAWFGGIAAEETGTLSQDFTVASSGTGQLDFWMVVPNGAMQNDSMLVLVDGNTAWARTGL